MAEKYVRLVQDMYEESETVVRCSVGTTESSKVKVGLHQGSALSPFLFLVIMNRITDEVRREPPWTMLFADDIVICKDQGSRRAETRMMEVCFGKKKDEIKWIKGRISVRKRRK